MIAALIKSLIGRKISLVLIPLVIASLSIYFYSLKNDLEKTKAKNIKNQVLINQLSDEINNVSRLNDSNKKQFDIYIKDTNKAFLLLNEEYKKRVKKESFYEKKIKEIQNAKKSDDGDVAPVLLDTFKWLQHETNRAKNQNSH